MKLTARSAFALLALSVGAASALAWSARMGRRVWSPRVFAWRNFLRRPPKIEDQPECPLLITNPRYYSFMSIGSAVGGVLRFDVINRSDKLVHSYDCRWYSPDPFADGAYGSQPDAGVLPGQMTEGSISAHDYAKLTLAIDFVQFADGTTWFSNGTEATAKPEGVTAGAEAAAKYLLEVLEREGAAAVLDTLPRIHAEVRERNFSTRDASGCFGFYCGVTNASVRAHHAHRAGGLATIESELKRLLEEV